MNIDALKTELSTDPLTVGYSEMDDATAADSLNDTSTGRTLPVDIFSGAEIFEMIDAAEFDALTAADKVLVDRVLGLGDGITVSPSSKARVVLLAAFDVGTVSRMAMVAAVSRTVSRAEELGLGFVYPGHVQTARL